MIVPDVDNSPRRAGQYAESARGRSVLLALFILSLLLPIRPDVAGLRLDPYRFLLLIMFVPFLIKLFSGQAGRFTSSDGLLVLFVLWIIFTFIFHHGPKIMPYALATSIELLGGYMAGRLLVRSAADYRRFIRFFMIALLVMFPLAIFELLTFRMPISEILGPYVTAIPKFMNARYGLSRVQVVFPHAIHFGFFCSLAVANIYYLYRGSLHLMLPQISLVLSMIFMSLSSAPLLSALLQILLIIWGKLTAERWRLLIIFSVSAYVIIELLSNRGPIVILIETMTLNPETAWWRVHIWNFGSQSVLNNPFFGIGLNDWVRPKWLAETVDNYWLVVAMRHGFPGIALLITALTIHIYSIVRVSISHSGLKMLRTGYTVSLIGMLLTLATVHVWDAMNAFIMFYIGAGAFLYTSFYEEEEKKSPPNHRHRARKTDDRTIAKQGLIRKPPLPFSQSQNQSIHQFRGPEEQ